MREQATSYTPGPYEALRKVRTGSTMVHGSDSAGWEYVHLRKVSLDAVEEALAAVQADPKADAKAKAAPALYEALRAVADGQPTISAQTIVQVAKALALVDGEDG